MSIYEPKTDSREFEVPDPAQCASAATSALPEPTDISIRLWGVQATDGNSLTWTSDSVCVFMIADLVTASGGRLDNSGVAGMAARFDNAGQALVGARRIQTSLLEFCSGHSDEAVGAVVLIHSSFEPGFNTDTVRSTLSLAKPGQILLAETISQRWAGVPGLEFRPAPGISSGGTGQPALTELLWTSPEELQRLQHAVQDEPAGQKSESLAVGATMIVESPFLSSGRSTPDGSLSPVNRTGEDAIPADGGESGSNPLLQELEDNPPFWTRTKAIVGVLALVLIAGLIAVVYWPMPESRKPGRVQPQSDSGGPNPVQPGPVATTPPVLPQPKDTKPPADSKPVEPEKKVPTPVVTKPQPQKKVAPPVIPVTPTIKSAPVVTPDAPSALLKSDIAQLLRVAQTSLGEGRYDDARAAYRKILQLQPDNLQAKEGLHKIDLIKSNSDN